MGFKQKWTAEEELALRLGVTKYGKGKWRAIQKDPELGPVLANRSNIDLKDKWRNLNIKAPGSRRVAAEPAESQDEHCTGDACTDADEHRSHQQHGSIADPNAGSAAEDVDMDDGLYPLHAPSHGSMDDEAEAQRHAVIDHVLRMVGFCDEGEAVGALCAVVEEEMREEVAAERAAAATAAAAAAASPRTAGMKPSAKGIRGQPGSATRPEVDPRLDKLEEVLAAQEGRVSSSEHPQRKRRRSGVAVTVVQAAAATEVDDAPDAGDEAGVQGSMSSLQQLERAPSGSAGFDALLGVVAPRFSAGRGAPALAADQSEACAASPPHPHLQSQAAAVEAPACDEGTPLATGPAPPPFERSRSSSHAACDTRAQQRHGAEASCGMGPSPEDMVVAAIACMREPGGSQLEEVYDWIEAHYAVAPTFRRTVLATMQQLARQGRVFSPGPGSTSYQLAGVDPEAAAAAAALQGLPVSQCPLPAGSASRSGTPVMQPALHQQQQLLEEGTEEQQQEVMQPAPASAAAAPAALPLRHACCAPPAEAEACKHLQQHSDAEEAEGGITCALGGAAGAVCRAAAAEAAMRAAEAAAAAEQHAVAAQLTSHVMRQVSGASCRGLGPAAPQWGCLSAAIYGGYE